MTVCQIKKVLTVWNNGCRTNVHEKSPNIRQEGLLKFKWSSIM